MAAYAVSKAALVYLTRVLDLELRPLGIRASRGSVVRASCGAAGPCFQVGWLAA